VNKVVVATAAEGAVLPIAYPSSNSSWALEFAGPSLKCSSVQGEELDAIIQNINDTVQVDDCTTSYGYISWTPGFDDDGSEPFVQTGNGTYSLRSETLGAGNFSSTSINDIATIYIASLPNMVDEVTSSGCSGSINNISFQLQNISVVQCALFNSSYHATFEFVDGTQSINITQDETYNAVAPINGLESSAGIPFPVFSADGPIKMGEYNLTAVQTLSYQSVMDALGQILVGSIYNDHDTSDGALVNTGTSTMSTILSNTAELQFLSDYPRPSPGQIVTLQQAVAQNATLYFPGLSAVDTNPYNLSLANTLEDLFQNITISLMSSALLQPNASSIYAPPLTNVTLPSYRNIYVYSSHKLWLAYGAAILFALIGVLIGLLALLSNGISYSSSFSTILRASRHANITAIISPTDADGRDPLPVHLAKANVFFPDNNGNGTQVPLVNFEYENGREQKTMNSSASQEFLSSGTDGYGYERALR